MSAKSCLETSQSIFAYLDSGNVGVLADILVLVQGILRQFALLLDDRLLNQQEHDRLQRRDGDISRPFRSDVLVQEDQGSLGLPHAHQLMGALENILRLLMRRRRHAGQAPLQYAIWRGYL